MLIIIGTLISYILFVIYFNYYLKRFNLSKNNRMAIALALSIPALNIHSTLFLFMIHLMVLTLLFDGVLKLCGKENHTHFHLRLILPIPLIVSLLLFSYGYWNMHTIVKQEYDVVSNINLSKDYKIVLLSDMHYPVNLNQNSLTQLLQRIDAEEADVVVLAGDIIDEYTKKEAIIELFDAFKELAKTNRIILVNGNHDKGIYALNKDNFSLLKDIIKASNIEYLVDETITLNDELVLIGRDDYSNKLRKPLSALLEVNHDNYYTIVIDHQPKEYNVAASVGVDLHLSGHTHGGQIFPLGYLYDFFSFFDNTYGIKNVNNMTAITTSGIAGWGFDMRSENKCEYVVINIKS